MDPENRDYLLGVLSAQLDEQKKTLEEIKDEQKSMASSLRMLENWKTEVMTTCCVASGIFSGLFYCLSTLWRK